MLSQEKAKEAKKKMLSWGREMNKQLQTEISAEGVADALLKAAEAEKRKKLRSRLYNLVAYGEGHLPKRDFPRPREKA